MQKLLTALEDYLPPPDELIEFFKKHLSRKDYSADEVFLKEGSICRYLWFIESGMIRHFTTKGKKEATPWVLWEGHFVVSFDSFVEQQPAEENIQALEDTVAWCISYEKLMEGIELFDALRLYTDKIKNRYRSLGEKNWRELQALSPTEKYVWLLTNQPEVARRASNAILMSYLDVTEYSLLAAKRNLGHK